MDSPNDRDKLPLAFGNTYISGAIELYVSSQVLLPSFCAHPSIHLYGAYKWWQWTVSCLVRFLRKLKKNRYQRNIATNGSFGIRNRGQLASIRYEICLQRNVTKSKVSQGLDVVAKIRSQNFRLYYLKVDKFREIRWFLFLVFLVYDKTTRCFLYIFISKANLTSCCATRN